jgi:hypothetical protein
MNIQSGKTMIGPDGDLVIIRQVNITGKTPVAYQRDGDPEVRFGAISDFRETDLPEEPRNPSAP